MIEFWRHLGTGDRFTTVWNGIFLEISLPDNYRFTKQHKRMPLYAK